jgi:hypothetical protein
MSDIDQPFNVETFLSAAQHLERFAQTLVTQRSGDFSALDVSGLILGAGVKCLVASLGFSDAAKYLRYLADSVETIKRMQN